MQLAFHGACTIKAKLETDIRNAQKAGYSALEIWTEKLDVYLEEINIWQLFPRHNNAFQNLLYTVYNVSS